MHDPEEDQLSSQRLGEIGLNNFAPYLMNRILGRYNSTISEQLTPSGLTTPKLRILAVLSVLDGIQSRELAVYSVIKQSTLSRALDALESEGLVRRKDDPKDSRAARIFITEEGRTAFEAIWPVMAGAYGQMFKGIGDEEHQAFVATLQKILTNIRKHDF